MFESVAGDLGLQVLVLIYIVGIGLTSVLRYLSASDSEKQELADDIDEL